MSRLTLLFVAGPAVVQADREALERDDRFDVSFADSKRAALDALDDGAFDCAVTTYGHPDTEGGALLEAVRATQPDLPVVVYSGETAPTVVRDLMAREDVEFVPRGTENALLILTDRVVDLVERHRVEQQAEDLQRVASVLSDVNRLLVRAETRTDIEQGVCDRLAASEPYLFAWIGGLAETDDRIVPRAWAGDVGDYLDDITVTTDAGPTGSGPAGHAIRTGEVQVVQHLDDPRFAPWRDDAARHGVESVAAVPLTHGEVVYGMFAVYADRPSAFGERERDLLAEVGHDIGYAIHNIETREALARHARLVETLPVGVFRTDPTDNGVIREANPGLATILGADSVEEVVGLRPADFYADPSVRESFLDDIEVGDVLTREFDIERLDGGVTTVEATLVLHESATEGTTLVGALRDVSVERQLEADLEDERAFVEHLFETSPVAITVLDADGQIVRANEYAEEVLGLDASELAGRPYDAPEWEAIDESGTPLTSDDLPFTTVRETGEPVYGFEHAIRRPSGDVVWLSINMVPMFEDGELVRAVATLSDVTAQKQYERAILQRQDQLEFFNSLLRHEVLNGMTVVLGHIDTLTDALAEDDPLRESVDIIESRSVGVVTRVKYVRRILERLAAPGDELVDVDLASTVTDRVERLQAAHPDAEVSVQTPETAPVTADDLLGEVVAHLVENAIVHSDRAPPRVAVSVEVGPRTTTLRVADEGPGISDDVWDAVFDHEGPRTTTGGFGLYLVDSLTARYGGTVSVADNEPRGTVVTVEFRTA
jgi:PAS domain S-box-containing protein